MGSFEIASANSETNLSISLPNSRSMAALVCGRVSGLLPGEVADVMVRPIGRGRVDATGRYELHVPAILMRSETFARLVTSRGRMQSRQITITEGDEQIVHFDLGRVDGICGRVARLGVPVSGASELGEWNSVRTDAAGEFILSSKIRGELTFLTSELILRKGLILLIAIRPRGTTFHLRVAGGESCRRVALLFDEDPRTVQRWVRTFEAEGFEGLRDGDRSGRPPSLTAEQLVSLGRDLRRPLGEFGLGGHLWDGPLLSGHLRRAYGVALGVRQCQRLFRRLGFRLRKSRPVLERADPEPGEACKKLHELAARGDVELWSQDECHFQQHGTRCRVWVPPEERDPVVTHAATFLAFLKVLLRRRSRKRRMVVVLDNARYHHANLLESYLHRHRGNLELLFLPPYSPHLAPVERVWKLPRRLATHNRHFGTLDELSAAVESCFQNWNKPNPVLQRLCGIT